MNLRIVLRVLLGLAVARSLPSLQAAPPVNLALHCEYASSDPNTFGWEQPGLTDGVWGSDSTTCYATGKNPVFPKFVTVDLRSVHPVSTVVFGVPPFGSTKTVNVSVSVDNVNFSPLGSHVFDQGAAQRAVVTGTKTDARYVRLTYQDHYPDTADTPGAFAFTSELEVYEGDAPAAPDPALTASTPASKDLERHQVFLERIAAAPADILFLGDSIIDRWPRWGEPSWLKLAPYQPANFGVGGDQTENLLWRIENGELDGIHPKVVVIMIGTNNAVRDQPAWTAAGIAKIVETARGKLPEAKILLVGLLPRDLGDSVNRKRNAAVNVLISKLADGHAVSYLDIGTAFLDDEGEIPLDLMPDRLHPSVKGYEIWYHLLIPKLKEMLR